MTTVFYRFHVNHIIGQLIFFFYVQNFHQIYRYVAIGNNIVNSKHNYTQFMLRYIQVHIISTILSESIFLIREIGDTECVY